MFENPDRRLLLKAGGLGVLGAMFGRPSAGKAAARERARAKSVIFLYQWGGPSHLETFDMKPDAPAEIRGNYKPTTAKVPGLLVCEKIPKLAAIADRYTVIRSVKHTMKNHNSAGYYTLTGHTPATDDQRLRDSLELFPSPGSVVDRFKPAGRSVPTSVSYPYVVSDGSITPGQHASFLGKIHDPLFVGEDPASPTFRMPELSLPDHITPQRMENRKELLRLIDNQTKLMETSPLARGIDESYQKALSMLASPVVKQAFDLTKESATTRNRYGRHTYGQGCLLARRLVEAGVKFVTVYFAQSIGGPTGGWDVHSFDGKPMWPILENHLLPKTDQSVSALIEDLDERGLLDDTLVLWMGEFGRTPRINKNQGRDHWPQCYTVMMSGGGIKRGGIVGASDRRGAFPAGDAFGPEDVTATVFESLGIPAETEVRDKLDRPLPISRGKAIHEAIA